MPLWHATSTARRRRCSSSRTQPWIAALNAWYHLGIDGISLPLIVLTAFMTPLVVIAAWTTIEKRPSQYFAAFLVMEGLMIGVFSAADALLFYVFWEAMLIPMFLIIGIWGGARRVYATIKFFLYTFLGSVLMLVALIYLYLKGGSYEIAAMQRLPLGMTEQTADLPGVLRGLRGQDPDVAGAHLAAGCPRRGADRRLGHAGRDHAEDGRLRLPALQPADHAGREPRARLAGHHAVADRGRLHRLRRARAARHEEADRLFVDRAHGLRHARVIHRLSTSCCDTGAVSGAAMGLDGAMVQMVSHGLVSGALFLCVGVLYDRLHTREISAYGGVVNTMPVFAFFAVLFAMANAGLPGTSGFVGEFLVIIASFKANFWYAFVAALTLILGAAYTLWLVKRVIWGDVGNDGVASLKDLNAREFLVLAVLAAAVLLLGVWPAPLLDVMRPTLEWLVQQMMVSKL